MGQHDRAIISLSFPVVNITRRGMVALSYQSCGKAQREIVINFMFITGNASKLSYWNYLVLDCYYILVTVHR